MTAGARQAASPTAAPVTERALRVLFVMEQHLGHRTYCDNLRASIGNDPAIDASWIDVAYAPMTGVLERLPMPGALRGRLRGRAEVRQALASIPHDVAFFNTHVPALMGGVMTRRTPYVISTDITPCQYDAMGVHYGRGSKLGGPVAWLRHRQHAETLRGAAAVLPWSSWVAKSMVADYGVRREQVHVVPPGVDLAIWRPAERVRDAHSPVKLLFVGGDFERKGGPLLLDAFRTLPAGSAELHLVTRSAVTPSAGVFVHHGMTPNQPELIDLFRDCDVFVLPTVAEAFGIVAVEASACGMPVVGTAVGGLTDVIVDGETGFLMPSGDGEVLAARLQQLVADATLRARLGAATRARALSHFDGGQTAQRVVTQLRRAVGIVA
ncbi:MAG: glycosyltransferase family 4 protein [Gemmatimonadota bacterium]